MKDMFAAPQPVTLWPHQAKAIQMLRSALAQGLRRVVIQMPTAAGKTVTAAEIIKGAQAKGNRVIFTAPAVSLIGQTVKGLEEHGVRDIGVMQADHPRTNPLAQVQVATVQTLARRDMPPATLVIVDEAHIRSDVIDKLMMDRPDVFFIGLSATPWRKGMGLVWQDMVIPVTIAELIEAGVLSRFVAYAPDVPNLTGVKVRQGEFDEAALEALMGEAKLLGSVVQTWLEKGENRPTLCFCVNRAHAAQVRAEFERAGVASAYVDGNTDTVERDVINRQFRAGEYAVICSVRTMTTGVDLPVSCVIDAAPTRSEMLHCQKIGRGMRVKPGTEDLVILDHAGNSLRLGLVTDIYHGELDRTAPGDKQASKPTAEKLPKPCPKCETLHTAKACPECGHERAPPQMDAAEGHLVEVDGKKRVYTKAEKQAWFSGLLTIQRAKGRSKGWTANTYRDRFSVWPKGLDEVAGPPTPDMWNYVKAKDIRFAKRREVTA